MSTAISARDLTKTYGPRTALDRLSLDVPRGSRTVVLGHNGAGKSTFLEIVATLRTPTAGTVSLEGVDVVRSPREARRLVGLTPQSDALDPRATPEEVLRFHGVALGLGARAATARARELIDIFAIGEHRATRISRLSGGTRRKVDLAVALVAEPPVVILDEPSSGLDPISRLGFWDELRRLSDAGTTLLISTQDLHEADVLATDIAVLREGTVVAHGSPDSLKQRVGERTLTLRVRHEGVARHLLDTGHRGLHADPDEPCVLRLPLTDDPTALRAALEDVARVAEDVDGLRLGDASLDDVFVALAAT